MIPLNMHKDRYLVIRQGNQSTTLVLIILRYMHVLMIVCYIGGNMEIERKEKYVKHLDGSKGLKKMQGFVVWKGYLCLQRQLEVWCMVWYPRDSKAWNTFDLKYFEFTSYPSNVQLALVSDDFNTILPNGHVWSH